MEVFEPEADHLGSGRCVRGYKERFAHTASAELDCSLAPDSEPQRSLRRTTDAPGPLQTQDLLARASAAPTLRDQCSVLKSFLFKLLTKGPNLSTQISGLLLT